MVAIQYAFSTLQNAATVVRKDPDYQPPADNTDFDHRGRLHRALDLLRDARDAVDVPEDDHDARPLKASARWPRSIPPSTPPEMRSARTGTDGALSRLRVQVQLDQDRRAAKRRRRLRNKGPAAITIAT